MEFEMVREIQNQCPNNQMRDIFFDEVDTNDPAQYVRDFLKGRAVSVSAEEVFVAAHILTDSIPFQ